MVYFFNELIPVIVVHTSTKSTTLPTKKNHRKDCDAYFKSNIQSVLIYRMKQWQNQNVKKSQHLKKSYLAEHQRI